MFNYIKKSLRFTTETFDDEIKSNIDVALAELERIGIETYNANSESIDVPIQIQKVCELYNKAEFNFLGKGEIYRENYEKLKIGLSLSSKFKKPNEDEYEVVNEQCN